MTSEEALSAAWTFCAPNRLREAPFPVGFWPDIARVATAMMEQQTRTPKLDFQPTMCVRGNFPEHRTAPSKKLKGLDLGKLQINL